MKNKKEINPITESNSDEKHLINSPKNSYIPNQSLPLDFVEKSPFAVSISNYSDIIACGDCESLLKNLPDNTVDLIVTSPPYADQRTSTYGGISPDHYVQWFLPKADEFFRILKPTGSFILNIKERVVDGERHTYVMELVMAMRKHGWFWIEEYLWHKKNSHPGKWPNRFRDINPTTMSYG